MDSISKWNKSTKDILSKSCLIRKVVSFEVAILKWPSHQRTVFLHPNLPLLLNLQFNCIWKNALKYNDFFSLAKLNVRMLKPSLDSFWYYCYTNQNKTSINNFATSLFYWWWREWTILMCKLWKIYLFNGAFHSPSKLNSE